MATRRTGAFYAAHSTAHSAAVENTTERLNKNGFLIAKVFREAKELPLMRRQFLSKRSICRGYWLSTLPPFPLLGLNRARGHRAESDFFFNRRRRAIKIPNAN